MFRIRHRFFTNILAANFSVCRKIENRERHFWKNMGSGGVVFDELQPPDTVRGMMALDRNAFRKRIRVPVLKVNGNLLNRIRPMVQKILLKMEHLKPVRSVPRNDGGGDGGHADKEILLHPSAVVAEWNSSMPLEFEELGLEKSDFYYADLELTYENWKADEILKSILPKDQEGFASYSRIGHVVHINLRDHLEPYKRLIGEVLLDKIVGCRAVVNKAQNIGNTYRNFELELICGEQDYQVEVKEHGVTFQFDFSTVYWNPRLSTEHSRIVELLQSGDVLYDVFAGVGPFSIPAAKKGCTVLANDLNPESFKWLNVNAIKNKCQARIQTFNKDGRDFIRDDICKDLAKMWKKTDLNYKIHITMNLPALAVEFLNEFDGMMSSASETDFKHILLPIVHVYTFIKAADNKEKLALNAVETNLNAKLDDSLIGVYFVRNVAPNKDMFRVSFHLPKQLLFSSVRKRHAISDDQEDKMVAAKKSCA